MNRIVIPNADVKFIIDFLSEIVFCCRGNVRAFRGSESINVICDDCQQVLARWVPQVGCVFSDDGLKLDNIRFTYNEMNFGNVARMLRKIKCCSNSVLAAVPGNDNPFFGNTRGKEISFKCKNCGKILASAHLGTAWVFYDANGNAVTDVCFKSNPFSLGRCNPPLLTSESIERYKGFIMKMWNIDKPTLETFKGFVDMFAAELKRKRKYKKEYWDFDESKVAHKPIWDAFCKMAKILRTDRVGSVSDPCNAVIIGIVPESYDDLGFYYYRGRLYLSTRFEFNRFITRKVGDVWSDSLPEAKFIK